MLKEVDNNDNYELLFCVNGEIFLSLNNKLKMVEHRDTRSTTSTGSKKIKRRTSAVSPPSLPPRWGEGVAPPTTPQFTSQYNTPETSPEYVDVERPRVPPVSIGSSESQQNPPSNAVPHYPTSGAELLEDLHRRLQAQSINGGNCLPARPRVYRHKHRARSRARSNINTYLTYNSSSGHKYSTNTLPKHPISVGSNFQSTHYPATSIDSYPPQHVSNHPITTAPMPDLLPTSAWNNPSRHTQYQLLNIIPDLPPTSSTQLKQSTSKPVGGSCPTQSLPTSDYSTSPSASESPPLILAPTSPSPPPIPLPSSPVSQQSTNLPLTIPSPPLQRTNRRRRGDPLTSTMLEPSSPTPTPNGSGGGGSSAVSSSGQMSAHPTSPVSPLSTELSSIPVPVRNRAQNLDETTYQNIAQAFINIMVIFTINFISFLNWLIS